MRFDLHIHSKYSSDGVLEPREIVRLAVAKGLSGIAVTDHNTIRGGEEARNYAVAGFEVIVGAEIMTDKGELIGLFLSNEVKPSALHDVVAQIRKQGGMVVVPHPFDRMRHSAFRVTEEYVALVDAVEGFNARCVFRSYNDRATEFAVAHGLPVVGGSDAHYASEVGLGGIQTHSSDVRQAISLHQLEIFGRRSPLVNHVRTKLRKWSRKTTE